MFSMRLFYNLEYAFQISLSYEREVFNALFIGTYSRIKIYSGFHQDGQSVRKSMKLLFSLWNIKCKPLILDRFFDACSCSSTSERRIFVAGTLSTLFVIALPCRIPVVFVKI